MFIEKISINNFRIYQGLNELQFSIDHDQNVSIISGNNGFGKTSLLTSLVWGLYGKLMSDVDERYRKEIYESGGYKRFCEKIMNKAAMAASKARRNQPELAFAGKEEVDLVSMPGKASESFSVSIRFTKMLIPSISCENVQVTRTYHIHNHEEEVEILIDGKVNELTSQVGPEIFINDFILPKEIAKFFFFDAEKIVSLAEIRSTEEKKSLSQAYGEVLGIKKYLDLKENLQNLRLRLRKKTGKTDDGEKADKLAKHIEQNTKLLTHLGEMITEKEGELDIKKKASDKLQERLIREGSTMTLNELKALKELRNKLSEEGSWLKNQFRELMDLAPFAIAANKLDAAIRQLEAEQEQGNKELTAALLRRKHATLLEAINQSTIAERSKEAVAKIVDNILLPKEQNRFKTLFQFSADQQNRFIAIYENVQNAYNKAFRNLISDMKKQQTAYNSTSRRLQDSESKEEDPVVQEIRNDKNLLDEEIRSLEKELIELKARENELKKETGNLNGQRSELAKKVKVNELDAQKDATAARLVNELEDFIHKLKVKKKVSLERNILKELNRLMHKSTFVSRVEVIIEGDLIDIELYDNEGTIINKDGLSKGEQQLYATALLKALVDESNIRFPVFIDSPLQKFDQEHAHNIIVDFYPNIAGQVIVFPLLEKELNEKEYRWLLPRVGKAYLINNLNQYHSQFKVVNPERLFSTYRKIREHVYEH